MITNRELPHVVELLERLPANYKSDVNALLDELEGRSVWRLNPEFLEFNKYKFRVSDGDVEIIIELGFATDNIRIVDIRRRTTIKRILRKISRAIDITPKKG